MNGLAQPVTVPVTVLIVDDNAAKRVALRAVLRPLGYEIVEADSGVAALRCVMAQDFAVIMLDVRMPGMDGFETAALIRQRRQAEMTPIIFITAHSSDEITTGEGYAEGAVDFMFAPVPPDEIRAKVSVFANLFIKAGELAGRAREVQTHANQLRLLTDAAPIGIFQTDTDNRYVYTNPRWSEIIGVASQDASGRTWEGIIGTNGLGMGKADTGERPHPDLCHRYEIEVPGADARIVMVTSRSIPDSDGGVAGWVGTLADVTAETGAEVAMADARDKANEASRMKSDFLANMSHEIRTPMNGVIGMTDLLLETDLDSRQRDYAQTVRNSGETLLTIINDILDFSKVEAGMLEVENVEFSVGTVVEDVVDLLAGPARAKGLELMSVIESSVPAVVSGDPGRVRQVLTNLVGNAIKFTQAGEIVVRIAQAEVGDDGAVVRFEVSDTGDGVAPDKLDVIFQPFVQVETSTSRKYGGTGLGLAISGRLVALMGGDCGVTSRLDAGSTFWFTVCVQAGAGPSPDAFAPDPRLAGLPALIVDENPAQRAVLSEYLTGWGMTVTTAACADAAQGRFSVVVLDRTAGSGALDPVADLPLGCPVVLMSDLGSQGPPGDHGDPERCVALSKPVHRAELHRCVRTALGLISAAPAAAARTPQTPAALTTGSAGRLLLAEDNVINQKVAVAMLASGGYHVDTVANGAQAVEAVARQRYDAILMDCHMPDLNGYEATAAIRAHEGSGQYTPIIAMTAGARREDRERCMAEGMDGYLAKPIGKESLLALVAQFVGSGEAPADPPVDAAVFDELCALADDDQPQFVRELVDQFFRDTEPMLVRIRDALALGDAADVGRLAHAMRGTCGQLGGQRLAASCGRLEDRAGAGTLDDHQHDLHEIETEYGDLRDALTQCVTSVERSRAVA